MEQLTGIDPLLCPHCGKGRLRYLRQLEAPEARAFRLAPTLATSTRLTAAGRAPP